MQSFTNGVYQNSLKTILSFSLRIAVFAASLTDAALLLDLAVRAGVPGLRCLINRCTCRAFAQPSLRGMTSGAPASIGDVCLPRLCWQPLVAFAICRTPCTSNLWAFRCRPHACAPGCMPPYRSPRLQDRPNHGIHAYADTILRRICAMRQGTSQ